MVGIGGRHQRPFPPTPSTVQPTPAPSFGDTVWIRATPLTESLGLARRVGSVYGDTTPSVSGVRVIGDAGGDRALNVHFDDHPGEFWFAPDLVEFVHHTPGTEIRLDGSPVRWVRQENGEWREIADEAPRAERPWWKLW